MGSIRTEVTVGFVSKMQVRVLNLFLKDDPDRNFKFFYDLFESDKFFGDFFDFSFLLINLIQFADIDGSFILLVSLLKIVFGPLIINLFCAIRWDLVNFLIGKILWIMITGRRLKIYARYWKVSINENSLVDLKMIVPLFSCNIAHLFFDSYYKNIDWEIKKFKVLQILFVSIELFILSLISCASFCLSF